MQAVALQSKFSVFFPVDWGDAGEQFRPLRVHAYRPRVALTISSLAHTHLGVSGDACCVGKFRRTAVAVQKRRGSVLSGRLEQAKRLRQTSWLARIDILETPIVLPKTLPNTS